MESRKSGWRWWMLSMMVFVGLADASGIFKTFSGRFAPYCHCGLRGWSNQQPDKYQSRFSCGCSSPYRIENAPCDGGKSQSAVLLSQIGKAGGHVWWPSGAEESHCGPTKGRPSPVEQLKIQKQTDTFKRAALSHYRHSIFFPVRCVLLNGQTSAEIWLFRLFSFLKWILQSEMLR